MAKSDSKTSGLGVEAEDGHQDELFKVLSHSRRRFMLRYLQPVETPLSVDELTTELVAWEDQRTGADQSRDERVSIKISLLHNHLPKMADAGIIKYDATRQTVTLADGDNEVHAHLQAMTSD